MLQTRFPQGTTAAERPNTRKTSKGQSRSHFWLFGGMTEVMPCYRAAKFLQGEIDRRRSSNVHSVTLKSEMWGF